MTPSSGSFCQSLFAFLNNKQFLETTLLLTLKLTRKCIFGSDTFQLEVKTILKLLEPISKTIKRLEGEKQYVFGVHSELKSTENSALESVHLFSIEEQVRLVNIHRDKKIFVSNNVQLFYVALQIT